MMQAPLFQKEQCPKLLQVIGDDKLYPHWMVGWMTKGYGQSKEPDIA